ncbi:TssQ family T6SS-associated lipoprotein [Massilia pinisoli]|uniref:TssQ family T6SS-associated lipoprotein n=1 Tax=Massilia pinisoli TaxID=1772194 RepID=A0ABT1ZY05_9BURK|nr:TssQ family T6SS-associated lipoprotein [Massilia pinisoli]MCS0584494.1 TssQ family T6SS-associated lipoprotein [Massilia pinisoli]
MNIQRPARPIAHAVLLTAAAALLSGCAGFPGFDKTQARTPTHPKAVTTPEREAPAVREAPARPKEKPREREREREEAPAPANGLQEGIRLYNDGDYNGAIRRLSARDVNNGPLATRLQALKYLAFSYCVTSRPGPCRQAFDRALRLDPSFDLAPGEHGHPLWGPVFTKAKQAAVAR